jgi:uncharacterized protein (DUF58 family)
MMTLGAKTVAKAYLVIVLFLAVLVSPPLQLGIALALLALQLVLAFKSPGAGLELGLVFCSLIFLPLALETLVGSLFSVLFVIPALALFDQSLKGVTPVQSFSFKVEGRRVTGILRTLGVGLFLVFVGSVFLWNISLMLTSAVLAGYLSFVVAYFLTRVPRKPLGESRNWSRVVVGDSGESSVIIQSKSKMSLAVSLSSALPWVRIKPSKFVLPANKHVEVDLSFVPVLSGPSKPEIQALAVDSRGLVQANQVLKPVDLHIIPRAKYARWLAGKYLEQTSAGGAQVSSIPSFGAVKATRYGLEYVGSREYQPGDRWRDIDWKHTYLFRELVVKEFGGAQGQATILVADLTAGSAEEADRLSHDFVMAALTLATESLPTALLVYGGREVFAALKPMNPREALKKALELTKKMVVAEPTQRILQPRELRSLRRSISQLERLNGYSTERLGDILKFEFEANQIALSADSVGKALSRIAEVVPSPATLTVVSSLSSDNSVLGLTLDKLKERGYKLVSVGKK